MLQSRATAPLPPGVEERDGLFVDHRTRTVSHLDPRLPPSAHKLTARLRRRVPAYVLDTHGKQQQVRGRMLEAAREGGEDFVLEVRRDKLVEDSRVLFEQPPHVLTRSLKIRFVNEPGKDYGGMSAEWFLLLSRELGVLFRQTDAYEYVLDEASCSEDLCAMLGKLMALALLHGKLIELPLVAPYYKFLLGQPVGMDDLRSLDTEYYKSLVWVLEHNVSGLGMAFAVGDVPLLPGDQDAEVTEENKRDYVEACARYKLVERDRELLEALRSGFEQVVTLDIVKEAGLEPQELGLVLNGSTAIDVEDWMKHTLYLNEHLDATHPICRAFWDAVTAMSEHERRAVLRFATGTERVPCGGFANLQATRFAIALLVGRTDGLPSAHTCFNRLEFPMYNQETLARMGDLLRKAVECQSFEIE